MRKVLEFLEKMFIKFLIILLSTSVFADKPKKPNIVIITADDLVRFDFSCTRFKSTVKLVQKDRPFFFIFFENISGCIYKLRNVKFKIFNFLFE